MIEGVKIKQLTTHLTDDGYFREILRDEDNMLEQFGQSSVSLAHPGFIKAFHWHKEQDDVWCILSGQVRTVLYDTRKESPTYKEVQTIIMGQDKPQIVLIPKGVAHGYQVLGKDSVLLLYYTTKHYNPEDEHRIAFDDPEIGYDWSIKNG
jgi:dTDP-4-dehydrorhamnose 3,5-epimerase